MDSGQTIAGKYRLNRVIGSGGMASVWSATNIFTEREFAIKFMLPQVARTPEAARRFLLEAKVSARINHPNIIEVIDVGQAEDGSLFMVMELLSGQALETAMKRQVPPMLVAEFCAFMLDVAKALAAAHKSGVVHRDLKPTNVYLHRDRDGNVMPKILDFGVSKILEDETNTALTVAGTVLGSPLYMSPEQAMGSTSIDGRTDIFAFGSILFEALTARRAFDAPNFNALIVTIATTQPKKIDDVAPNLPESLRSIVRECMVTDVRRRLASFDLVVERLAQALPEIAQSPMRLPSPRTIEPPSDPDATNALPVLRPSDRPPPYAALQNTNPPASGQPRSGEHPITGVSSPWATPSGGSQGAVRRPSNAVLLLGAGGLVLAAAFVALLAILVARTTPRNATAGPSVAASAPSAIAPPSPSAPASNEPPLVSVDSLPHASSRPGMGPRGIGHLSVAAAPGWCAISVDGIKQGPTPIASLELAAGSHRLECTPPGGHTRTASVVVNDGVTAKYKFALDD
jgi:serine/threonine-protein kinase